ncbi:MAG: hypothetical protein JSW34_03195 [Candidatus Zixiibacteriota bacterium]|nr:MAG: hypothetical protein JSW34_03195 [candidate division Zixibacteria bacterium]
MMKGLLAGFAIALCLCPAVGAAADTTYTDSSVAVDTLLFDDTGLLEGTNPATSPINFEERLTQNPTGALFKSMLIPGWGQLGNRKYFKAVLFAGLDAWFIGSAIHYGQQASDFREQFDASTDPTARNEFYDLYLDRKDERNKFTWFAVIITFVSMFDAYADAHLSGYPKRLDDDAQVGLRVRPSGRDGFLAAVTVDF